MLRHAELVRKSVKSFHDKFSVIMTKVEDEIEKACYKGHSQVEFTVFCSDEAKAYATKELKRLGYLYTVVTNYANPVGLEHNFLITWE